MNGLAERTARILQQPGFAGLLGSAFALGLGYSFVAPFLSLWGTEEVGMRPAHFGVFMTATSLCGIIVTTALARWSDTHVPRKVMLLVGAAGGVLGYAGYAVFRAPWILLAVGTTMLALSMLCFSQLFAHTRERFAGHEIPGVPSTFMMSVVRVCFSLAWTAGPSIGAWMMVHYGFRGLFLGASVLFFVFFLGVVQFVPFEAHPPHRRTVRREPLWTVLTRGDVLAMFIAFLLIFAAHTVNVMNLPLVITRVLGGTGRDVGIAFGVGPLVELPLMLWFGLLAGRGHGLRLIRIGAVVTVLYFLLLLSARAPWHVYPIQILHGLSFAIISNVAIVFFQDLVPGQPGLATAIFTNASNVGHLLGYFAFGSLAQPFGHRGLFLVSALLTAVTCVLVIVYRPRITAPPMSG